jgi:acyl-coenzyme A synthetase/AMP-(fatty) acid ligase
MEALPKNNYGKIVKRHLADMLQTASRSTLNSTSDAT